MKCIHADNTTLEKTIQELTCDAEIFFYDSYLLLETFIEALKAVQNCKHLVSLDFHQARIDSNLRCDPVEENIRIADIPNLVSLSVIIHIERGIKIEITHCENLRTVLLKHFCLMSENKKTVSFSVMSCPSLTAVDFDKANVKLCSFRKTDNLEWVSGSGLQKINNNCFAHCKNLRAVHISGKLGDGVFDDCPNLVFAGGDYSYEWMSTEKHDSYCGKSVEIDRYIPGVILDDLLDAGVTLTNPDGVNINGDFICIGSTLLRYRNKTRKNEIVIPDGITTIVSYAFSELYGKTSHIKFPSSLKEIESDCTSSMDKYMEFSFPENYTVTEDVAKGLYGYAGYIPEKSFHEELTQSEIMTMLKNRMFEAMRYVEPERSDVRPELKIISQYFKKNQYSKISELLTGLNRYNICYFLTANQVCGEFYDDYPQLRTLQKRCELSDAKESALHIFSKEGNI